MSELDKSEPYWVIEKIINGTPHWWVRKSGQYGDPNAPERWTTNIHNARHYSCKGEAIFVMGNDMPGCIATEHLDCAGPSISESKEPTSRRDAELAEDDDENTD